VRELERLMERAVALADTDVIELDDLPPAVRGEYATSLMPSLARRDTLRAWGARYTRLVLERCGGNKREACRVLDISYHTLQAYLRCPAGSTADVARGAWPPALGHPEASRAESSIRGEIRTMKADRS
jgi:DNA-binding NtrC family response regulator